MTLEQTKARLAKVVRELAQLSQETSWVEFKENNAKPEEIGEYLSALSNSATLEEQEHGYLIWGVRDSDHEIVGTGVDPAVAKHGNEDLYAWLLRGLSPQVHFRFEELLIDGQRVVLLQVERATHEPVKFNGAAWIRIGSYKKRLDQNPDYARRLWQAFETTPYELRAAAENLTSEEVTTLIDYPAYFDLMKRSLPAQANQILHMLAADRMIVKRPGDGWNITNLGALLFAKNLDNFPVLARKAPRVVQYADNSRIETIKEQVGRRGYASGFSGLLEYINNLLPSNEVIEKALRTTVSMYPDLAVRELVANALIHQDFSLRGTGPLIEIFKSRVEISNPGKPLVDPDRFIDIPPRSRNEALAAVMRRVGICEERGSGWDKVAFEIEFHQLPAPRIAVTEDHTKVTLYAYQSLNEMNREDRIRAIYLHAALRYVNGERVTNTSIRERFNIDTHNSARASRLIKEALDAGFIELRDPEAPPKLRDYVPFWAARS